MKSCLKDSITKEVERAESFREHFSSLFSGDVSWWQIDCGRGWNNLIFSFLEEFKQLKNKTKKKIRITEIKQRYGDLKVNLTEKDEDALELVDKYIKLCGKYCEICGTGKTVKKKSHKQWVHNICEACYDKFSKNNPFREDF